jgi:hypothetical protein
MNGHEIEPATVQSATGLTLRWVMTSEGLRMQWTPARVSSDDQIVLLPLATPLAIQLAVA